MKRKINFLPSKRNRGLKIIVLLLIPLVIAFREKTAFPRIWTEAALKDWELPLANAAYTQTPISEEFYYRLPERII